MPNPFKRKQSPYADERSRLLEYLKTLDPISNEYQKVMLRLDELDKILNRTSELKKTVIPALGTVAGVLGIFGLQQFAGVIVPKALETIAARQEQKKQKELE